MNKVEYSFVVPVFNEKNNILPFILEINSSPGTKGIEEATKVNVVNLLLKSISIK